MKGNYKALTAGIILTIAGIFTGNMYMLTQGASILVTPSSTATP